MSLASPEYDSELDLIVKTINNESFNISALMSSSVLSLKATIRTATSISEDRQRLIYRGRVLKDDTSLSEYQIASGHVVHMVARPENYRELQSQANNASPPISDPTLSTPSPSVAPSGLSSSLSSTDVYSAPQASGLEPSSSLEHVRQDLLTLRTLLSTMNNSVFTARRSEGNNEAAKSADASFLRTGQLLVSDPQYFVGQWIDVKDTVHQWLEATILDINPRDKSLYIHYNGWPVRWDEWIRWDSPRLAPFRSRTVHSGGSTGSPSYASPTPVTTASHAPLTGVDDIRTILPELANIISRASSLSYVAAKLARDSLSLHPVTTPEFFEFRPPPPAVAAIALAEAPAMLTSQRRTSGRRGSIYSAQSLLGVGTGADGITRSGSSTATVSRTPSVAAGTPWQELIGLSDARDSETKDDFVSPDNIPFAMGMQASHSTIDFPKAEDSSDEEGGKVPDPEDAQLLLRRAVGELCPVLDRLGRLFVDLAPHLNNLAQTAHPSESSPPHAHERVAALSRVPAELNDETSSRSARQARSGAPNSEFAASTPAPRDPLSSSISSILRAGRPESPPPDRAFRSPVLTREQRSSASLHALTNALGLGGGGDGGHVLRNLSTGDMQIGPAGDNNRPRGGQGYLDIHIAVMSPPRRQNSVDSILSQALASLQAQSASLAQQQLRLETLRLQQEALHLQETRLRQQEQLVRDRDRERRVSIRKLRAELSSSSIASSVDAATNFEDEDAIHGLKEPGNDYDEDEEDLASLSDLCSEAERAVARAGSSLPPSLVSNTPIEVMKYQEPSESLFPSKSGDSRPAWGESSGSGLKNSADDEIDAMIAREGPVSSPETYRAGFTLAGRKSNGGIGEPTSAPRSGTRIKHGDDYRREFAGFAASRAATAEARACVKVAAVADSDESREEPLRLTTAKVPELHTEGLNEAHRAIGDINKNDFILHQIHSSDDFSIEESESGSDRWAEHEDLRAAAARVPIETDCDSSVISSNSDSEDTVSPSTYRESSDTKAVSEPSVSAHLDRPAADARTEQWNHLVHGSSSRPVVIPAASAGPHMAGARETIQPAHATQSSMSLLNRLKSSFSFGNSER